MAEWIASTQALGDFLRDAPTAERVGLDTEFVRERTYYAQLALVQIEHGRRIALVDPLAIDDPAPLVELLGGPALKVMHSPGEDLQAFAHRYRCVPTPLFDTQLAAALVGLGPGIGYQRLVETVLGVALTKGETRSDWLRRPLSEAQCEYAADDVHHLEALHDHLDARLEQLGRRGWLDQDCARMVADALDDSSDPNPHLAMRPAQRLAPEAQVRLRRLLLWREQEARQSDKPRRWILENEVALRLAERPPESRGAFERFLDAQPKSPRRKRELIWDMLHAPIDGDEQAMPLAVSGDDIDKDLLRAMQADVAAVASELQVPDGLLCARRHLESLLLERRWPRALEGWRAELLRDRLLARLP